MAMHAAEGSPEALCVPCRIAPDPSTENVGGALDAATEPVLEGDSYVTPLRPSDRYPSLRKLLLIRLVRSSSWERMAKRHRKKQSPRLKPAPPAQGQAEAPRREKAHDLLALGLLAFLSVAAFANSFVNDFAYDDEAVIVANRLIKSLVHLPVLFASDYWSSTFGAELGGNIYRPLVLASFALNYALGGLDPPGYHLVNVLLHVAVSGLLFVLGRNLGLSYAAALASAALFAVHPLHTEAVTGIVGRAELLMAFGVLLSMICYARGRNSSRPFSFYMLASWAAFGLALLSKEQALIFPALLVLTDVSIPAMGKGVADWRAVLKSAWRRYAGHLLILGSYLALRAAVLANPLFKSPHRVGFFDNPLAHVSWDQRVLTALKIAGRYLWLMVWPANLSADYSYNAIPIATSPLAPEVLLSGVAWCSLVVLGAYAYAKGFRAIFFGVGFVLLTFLPASNFLIPIGTIMGERLFYLPSGGLCLLLGGGWDRVVAWAVRRNLTRPIGTAGLASFSIVVLLLTARTAQRNQDWRNTETLMRSAAQVVPQSARVQNILAGFLIQARRWDEAIERLNRALTLVPDYVSALLKLGVAYHAKGRWEDAETAFQRALAISEKVRGPDHPNVADSLSGLGVLYATQAQALTFWVASAEQDQAEPLRQRALALHQRAWAIREKALGPEHPAVAESLDHLASVYMAQRKYAEAEPALRRALAIRETALGRQHRLVAESLEHLAAMLRATNRAADAAQSEAQARTIRARLPQEPR